jgi:hypothetical protein
VLHLINSDAVEIDRSRNPVIDRRGIVVERSRPNEALSFNVQGEFKLNAAVK